METDKIYLGDCLDLMKDIPDKSIDCIIADLPYNTTPLKWDCMIPFEPLWAAYKRIIKIDGAIILFAQQPFTTKLIASNLKMWKYNWIWEKDNGTNFLNSKYQPLKVTEDICVFSFAAAAPPAGTHMRYYPQFDKGEPYIKKRSSRVGTAVIRSGCHDNVTINEDGRRYPTNILVFKRDKEKYHRTQKPVNLIRYLIRTYTQENDIILDNVCGSGTTCIAAIQEHRHYIGIEKDPTYYEIACKRVREELQQTTLF